MAPLTLVSSDGESFKVETSIIFCSKMIKTMFDDLGHTRGNEEEEIPLPNVKGEILQKVIEWPLIISFFKDDPPPPEEEDDHKERRSDDLSSWDLDFLKIEQATLFELILAANYLDIRGLLDVTCKSVANMIKGKSPEEIRALFNIEDDLTVEEKEQIRKENEWCEEK